MALPLNRWRTRKIVFALAALVLAGCAILPRNAVPPELGSQAVIPGMPDIRAPAGRPSAAMASDLASSFAQEKPADFPVGPDGQVHYAHLALSGGGPNGAFGAGFLNGWTTTGRRPVFKIVTGVSTGALMAPFAFLGPDHDDDLREFYTTTSSRNIFRLLSIIPQLLGGESFADTGPLSALIAEHVTPELLREVAEAHRNGRRLYIGTADLDSQRFIVWNMGLIAISGRPEALDLFRKVMLASSSVPVAFPPVFFDVEAGGGRYDEMHVDGSVGTRVFYNGGLFSFSALRAAEGRMPGIEEIFVIHNGQLLPVAEATPRSLRGIATRSFDSAGKAAIIGDLFRIYAVSLRERAGYHWISIPEDAKLGGSEVFDPQVMGELYDVGYRAALAGPTWSTQPPGLRGQQEP
jgi:predicted acylesterase/phospholipase RssA